MFLMFTQLTPSSSISSIPNFFIDSNVYFVQRIGENNKDFPPYFSQIVRNNQYSPISVNQIISNSSQAYLLGFPNHSPIPRHARSHLTTVAFIASEAELCGDITQFLTQKIVMLHINPKYLFEHTYHPRNLKNFNNFFLHMGTSMLLLFSVDILRKIFVPCIICEDVLEVEINKITHLSELCGLWLSQNSNFAQNHVSITYPINLEKLSCGVVFARPNKKVVVSGRCKISHLSKIFNFYIVYYKQAKNPVSQLKIGVVLNSLSILSVAVQPFTHVPYSMMSSFIPFCVVTQYPSSLDGMNAFLLPLSATVWLVLFLSCVTICILAQFTEPRKSASKIMVDMVQIISMLMKQVNSKSLQIFCSHKRIGAGVISLWLLCGCTLIMDNLYTGEMFSRLSAITAPLVPGTLTELVESNIPIVTITGYNIEGSSDSVVLGDTIPTYLRFFQNRNKSTRLLRELRDKLVYVKFFNHSSGYAMFLKAIVGLRSMTSFNVSVDTSKTYAVIDVPVILDAIAAGYINNRTRLVFEAKEPTPFESISFDVTLRNFFYPLFFRRLSYLSTSGIEGRWANLERSGVIGITQRLMGESWNEIMFFANYKSLKRDSVVLCEKGPIRLKTVGPIFLVCGIMLLLSLACFVMEDRKRYGGQIRASILELGSHMGVGARIFKQSFLKCSMCTD